MTIREILSKDRTFRDAMDPPDHNQAHDYRTESLSQFIIGWVNLKQFFLQAKALKHLLASQQTPKQVSHTFIANRVQSG